MATPVGVTFHVSWSTVMSTALSSMFLIIISSFLVVSPLKFCVTAVKLAASLCCPIRQLVTRARATRRREKEGERGRRRRESIERKRARKSAKEKKRDEEEKGIIYILPAPLSPLSSIFERPALSSAH